jgi:hypothetical protein
MVTQLLNTNNLLYGTTKTIIDTSGGSNYLARGHLAPDANFIFNFEQVPRNMPSSFYPFILSHNSIHTTYKVNRLAMF